MSGKHGCCVDEACTEETCMELPDRKTCGDCYAFSYCSRLCGHKETDTYCDFFPRRFKQSDKEK